MTLQIWSVIGALFVLAVIAGAIYALMRSGISSRKGDYLYRTTTSPEDLSGVRDQPIEIPERRGIEIEQSPSVNRHTPSTVERDADTPHKPWRVWLGVVYSAVVGGVILWFAAIAAGGEGALAAGLLFFIAYPIAVIASAVATVLLIVPLWRLLPLIKLRGPVALVLVATALGLCIATIFLSKPAPLIDRLISTWWAGLWFAVMAYLFSLEAFRGHPAKGRAL